MVRRKEGVAEKILECAKKEFLKAGYSEASLRTIAKEAGTTTGTIYSRFKDKEGLFAAIVEPAAVQLLNRFREFQEEFHNEDPDKQPELMGSAISSGMDEMIDFMYDHFEEFQLLVDASYGTKFQDYVEKLVDIETEYTFRYMESVKIQNEESEFVTEEFVHIMSMALFESTFETIRHKMSREKAKTYVKMLERYHYAGWNEIFHYDK